jgi:Ca2+-binding RTX toxin-like protein
MLENLENRRLMSAVLNNGLLTITGTEGNDRIEVDTAGGTVYVFENNILSRAFPDVQVTTITVNALGGADYVKMWPSTTQRASINAGAGNDTVYASNSADTVYAGAGADRVEAGGGNDFISGEGDNDTLYGGAGNDSIYDALGNNIMYGEAGNDVLQAGSGADYLDGGTGNDVLSGQAGSDTLFGGSGRDTMFGGDGDDFFYARDLTRDRVDGGAGFDTANVDRFFGLSTISDVLISIERRV